MSVATHPGQTEFTRIRSARSSAASIWVSALSAVFDTVYAGVPPPMHGQRPGLAGDVHHPAMPPARNSGSNANVTRQAPSRFVSSASRTTSRSAFSARCQVS